MFGHLFAMFGVFAPRLMPRAFLSPLLLPVYNGWCVVEHHPYVACLGKSPVHIHLNQRARYLARGTGGGGLTELKLYTSHVSRCYVDQQIGPTLSS